MYPPPVAAHMYSLPLQGPMGPMGPIDPTILAIAFVVVLAVAVAAGYWVYKDASRRGSDSPGLWAVIVGGAFVLGFLFGIVALIVYVVVGRPDAPERTL